MNELVADFLAQHFSSLPFVTRAAGCVSVLVRSKKDQVDARIPVARRVFDTTAEGVLCLTAQDHYDLVPDGRQSAILYFEDRAGARVTESSKRIVTWEGRLKLVLWVNFKLIGEAYTLGEIERHVLANIPVEIPASGTFFGASVKPSKTLPKTPNPFAAYTYDEAQSQYLTAPYDYLSLELTYIARASRGCPTALALNPSQC